MQRWRIMLLVKALLASACVTQAVSEPSDLVDLCTYDEAFCSSFPFKSYSGLVPVSANGSIFYWYFVPEGLASAAAETPLVVWLQGGPGSSSMLGALFEIGPLTVNSSTKLVPRKTTWASKMPLLFIDSPVGTGWSHTTDTTAYARTEDDVARDLGSFLEQFVQLHPEAPSRLVLAGESYGGHYIPAVGAHLLSKPNSHFKLDGIAIGDGLTDPASQVLTKPATAFAFGLIDEKQLAEAQAQAQQAHDLAIAGDFQGALKHRNTMEGLVANASGVNLYDVRTSDQYDSLFKGMATFFALDATKDLLHIPRSLSFGTQSDEVEKHLSDDIMRSQKAHVEQILNASIHVLLYQGQFDWKDGAPSNEAWIRTLQWSGTTGYLSASRQIWHRSCDGKKAGWWRRFKNLEQVVIAGAGHLVPMNQPESAFDMISKFLAGDRHSDGMLVV